MINTKFSFSILGRLQHRYMLTGLKLETDDVCITELIIQAGQDITNDWTDLVSTFTPVCSLCL